MTAYIFDNTIGTMIAIEVEEIVVKTEEPAPIDDVAELGYN
jgi:hypothetical protein